MRLMATNACSSFLSLTMLALAVSIAACGPTPTPGQAQQPTAAATPVATSVQRATTVPQVPTLLPRTATPTAVDGLVRVLVADNYFDPPVFTVRTNTRVEFANVGALPHTVNSYTDYWNPMTLAVSQKANVVFGAPGTYNYLCVEHSGMFGSVVVVR